MNPTAPPAGPLDEMAFNLVPTNPRPDPQDRG